jgi:hypothetical protein
MRMRWVRLKCHFPPRALWGWDRGGVDAASKFISKYKKVDLTIYADEMGYTKMPSSHPAWHHKIVSN